MVRNLYDYVLIDTAPTLDLLAVNALAAADSVIIPVAPKYLDAKGLEGFSFRGWRGAWGKCTHTCGCGGKSIREKRILHSEVSAFYIVTSKIPSSLPNDTTVEP